jgi:hypothetical protein
MAKISDPMQAAQKLADDVALLHGQFAALKALTKRVAMLVVLPSDECKNVWDQSINFDLENWRRKLADVRDNGDDAAQLTGMIESAIKLFEEFLSKNLDSDAPA